MWGCDYDTISTDKHQEGGEKSGPENHFNAHHAALSERHLDRRVGRRRSPDRSNHIPTERQCRQSARPVGDPRAGSSPRKNKAHRRSQVVLQQKSPGHQDRGFHSPRGPTSEGRAGPLTLRCPQECAAEGGGSSSCAQFSTSVRNCQPHFCCRSRTFGAACTLTSLTSNS